MQLPPISNAVRSLWFVGAMLSLTFGTAVATAPPRFGPVPAQIELASQAGVLSVGPSSSPSGGGATLLAQPDWLVPVVLVDFPDQAFAAGSTNAHWDSALFDTTGATLRGSVYDYFRWASNGRARVRGRVVARIRMPQPKTYYANNSWGLGVLSTPNNIYGVIDEALRASDATVNWAPFDLNHDGMVDMLWVVHSGIGGEATVARDNLWSVTSTMSSWAQGSPFTSNDPIPGGGGLRVRIDRFSMLPELSAHHAGALAEIGVFCHEFGHALGLPDLYDTSGNSRNFGPGNWSLMSTGTYGGDGVTPESPAHPGAWASAFLGWAPVHTLTTDSVLTLRSVAAGGTVHSFFFGGENGPEHFMIEYRDRSGFDSSLPSEGLLVYHLDDALIGARLGVNRVNAGAIPGLRLVEADGLGDLVDGRSRGDASDIFPGPLGVERVDDRTVPNLRANNGTLTHTALEDITPLGDSLRVRVRTRPLGWRPLEVLPGVSGTPAGVLGSARRAARVINGEIVAASSEVNLGVARVIVRVKPASGPWGTPTVLNNGGAAATEPTLAAIGGNDAAAIWSDSRHGSNELYCRVRRQGVWMGEIRLTDLPGSSRYPAMVPDGLGHVHLVWQYTPPGGTPQLLYARVVPGQTAVAPVPVSPDSSRPDAPAIAATPTGGCYVLWPERATTPARLWFARIDPDSGVGPRKRLTPNDGSSQAAVAAAVDQFGTLHAVWPTVVSGRSEIHYHAEPGPTSGLGNPDSTLENRAEAIQNLALEVDSKGSMHMTFEALTGGVNTVRYRHRTTGGVWDFGSTGITRPEDGFATQIQPVPESEDRVTLVFGSSIGIEGRWMSCTRDAFATRLPTSAPLPAPAPPHAALRAHPNPLRGGVELRLRWLDSIPPLHAEIEVVDLRGRRMIARPLMKELGVWEAHVPGELTARWPAGVYFVRVAGGSRAERVVLLH
ncbi:MAG: M6 family metalloprotease domain-containing protein [Candidatus Eisenbacteria bacterium]|uniref:M6 family metalloprotease domain-containing protein n=1 Tax=Eiseniibacteriota bacterium TaxID=2212470 RepID=A0A849SDI5_UNCEI|nr:M6 family metalloprotease domain-containing protein [Candidatus Eisenbacteria bacterium]